MRINRSFLHFCRTIHIYLTMVGMLVLLGFGITGFTLNHEAYFGGTNPREITASGQMPMELIGKNDSLGIVENLRRNYHVNGAVTEFKDLGDTISVGFNSPSENWDVTIDKSTGKTDVRGEAFNFIAMVNNLHRGRYTGAVWNWVIDVSAGLIVLACVTGFVLWLALPKRRKWGITSLLAGAIATLVIFAWLVPGPDARATANPDAAATEPSAPPK